MKPEVGDDGVGDGAAAFGRLCVETTAGRTSGGYSKQPPSGGCVLKQKMK